MGEYLFDFRAVNESVNGQTFLEWYIDDYFFSPTGAGNPLVKGFYVDDSWGPGGPTEMDGNAVRDMGLSMQDVADITAGYLYATAALYPEILSRGKFVWDQTLNHDPFAPLNGDCPQPWVSKSTNVCLGPPRPLLAVGGAAAEQDAALRLQPGLLHGHEPGAPHRGRHGRRQLPPRESYARNRRRWCRPHR